MPRLKDYSIRPPGAPKHRLSKLETERAFEFIAEIFYGDGKLPSQPALAKMLGVQRNSIPSLVRRFHALAKKDRPSIEQRRETMARQLERSFARTVALHDAAVERGKTREAIEAVKAGADVLTRLAKIVGVEDFKPADEGRVGLRITIEGWQQNAPPAAIAAAARIAGIPTAPGAASLPRAIGTHPGDRGGETLG